MILKKDGLLWNEVDELPFGEFSRISWTRLFEQVFRHASEIPSGYRVDAIGISREGIEYHLAPVIKIK